MPKRLVTLIPRIRTRCRITVVGVSRFATGTPRSFPPTMLASGILLDFSGVDLASRRAFMPSRSGSGRERRRTPATSTALMTCLPRFKLSHSGYLRRHRLARATCLCVAVLALASGCDAGSDDGQPQTDETRTDVESDPATSEPAQLSHATSLAMRSGRGTATYRFRAPDPRQHSFTVVLEARADDLLAVDLRTPDTTLHVLRSTRQLEWCTLREADVRCRVPLPALEAQRPGSWIVVVRKTSRASTVARLSISFTPVG